MFDFDNANKAQKEAILFVKGPLLITAGPGTGKTFTLVQRTVYLIQECGVLPEQIFVATFTEKAAKEIITRITNELAKRNISVNINDMYIGTFHSLCLRIIKEHLEYTRLKKNYRLLDSFDQRYLVFRNINKFRNISNVEAVIPEHGTWNQAGVICSYVNNLSEELVDANSLINDHDPTICALGGILKEYQKLLWDENSVDFSAIQTECFRLLNENPSILEGLQNQLRYLMIDEYQDTNYIQERITFMLARKNNNICVVGDDDQGLYRFRGATIRNILEFPYKFGNNGCKVISLVENYRSNSDIVDFYNDWMTATDGERFKFDWGKYRYSKRIKPHTQTTIESPAVVKLIGEDDEDEWHENILKFINDLKNSGKLTDYNQLAFLFSSVKHERVAKLAKFLETHHINVYSPRSDMFFKRHEVMLTLGCLMLMFPVYVKGLEDREYNFLKEQHYLYFRECIIYANKYISDSGNTELMRFIKKRGTDHFGLSGTADYAYSGLLYQLFAFKPFSDILSTDMSGGVVDVRPVRNLAHLTQIIGKFEYLHNVNVLDGKVYKGNRRIDANTELLLNLYLRLLIDGGIAEYEDDSEYAPSGCVSFLTIHQSKGMEFPIVFVDSLGNVPRKSYDELMSVVEEKYFSRPAFEPYKQIKYFDFWRLYYTAFSRAQDLLVLTCNEDDRTPSKYFSEVYDNLTDVENDGFNIQDFEFHTVKNINIKDKFSFTSHISVYETCSLQYKFFKELAFMPVREGGMMFGTLVHQTIEDVHKAAIRQEKHLITKENITRWFETNYNTLVKAEHSYLAEPQRKVALEQVLRYVERQSGRWDIIQQAEVDVSLVKEDYIIEGKVDLVRGENGTVEIVDFKSERKPDMEKSRDKLEHYRRQLQLYAYLIEQRTGQKVSKMHVYYTGEDSGNPMLTYPYTKSAIEGTVAAFDDTVRKILRKEYKHSCGDPKICKSCDLRYYCQNK